MFFSIVQARLTLYRGLHVGHGVGGGTHAKTTYTAGKHRSVVVPAYNIKHGIACKYKHQHCLASQQQRQGQLGQRPQLQGDHHNALKQRQADAADVVDLANMGDECINNPPPRRTD